jgi:RHS repeat-associated protein
MRDVKGSFNTPKGFTGQDNDSLTGLDYYRSRYYDQVAGVFLLDNYGSSGDEQ